MGRCWVARAIYRRAGLDQRGVGEIAQLLRHQRADEVEVVGGQVRIGYDRAGGGRGGVAGAVVGHSHVEGREFGIHRPPERHADVETFEVWDTPKVSRVPYFCWFKPAYCAAQTT